MKCGGMKRRSHHLYIYKRLFYQDRLGTNIEKAPKKRWRFPHHIVRHELSPPAHIEHLNSVRLRHVQQQHHRRRRRAQRHPALRNTHTLSNRFVLNGKNGSKRRHLYRTSREFDGWLRLWPRSEARSRRGFRGISRRLLRERATRISKPKPKRVVVNRSEQENERWLHGCSK